ncbi:peptidase domain-containing ABC transporter [Cloacibacterium normanense]|uniref:peptidase domain-containing ABC transporter n=1 Tax=Cloacibacterium normanense TaxID=237258 RepID=UPI000853CD44|nr:ABC transporter ATP-binding protein [Cloacibacterium normanense]AZI70614.1 ABC transporter ATP-binding protein [Cloacibacterium normanense]SDO50457.1 ATP-binding cassette, subfamily B, MsbA [Cloacibacterium normanense]
MADSSKHTSVIGFFNYYRKIVGYKLYVYVVLNFLVGLLDGIGLTLFIPLLYLSTNTKSDNQSLGKLQFLVDLIEKTGFQLTLTVALILMVIIFFLKGILSYIRTILFSKIQLASTRKIRFRLVEGLRDTSYIGFSKIDSGVIQNNMTGETGRLVQSLILYFFTLQNVIMVITYLGLAFLSNWQFALLVLLGGLITNFIFRYLNIFTKKYANRLSQIGKNFQAFLLQNINHFKYLKATNYIAPYQEKIKKEIELSEENQYKIGKITAISDSLREPLIIIIIVIVIIVQINIMGGNMPSMMASLLLFHRSLSYLTSMQSYWNRFLTNIPGLNSVEEMLSEFKKSSEAEKPKIVESIEKIILTNISLQYDQHLVLDHINLSIQPKTSIALVGESGAGKTSLANVICGLVAPSSGEIFFKEKENLADYNINSFREHVGYITQESVIFDDTLYNNITFWAPKTPENLEKFKKAIQLSSLEEFLAFHKNDENLPLGNNGILISGGQKQRISIARELYKNPQLLIMDEATSALDSETEMIIKDNIDSLKGKFTMVIIAHRLSTIKDVDVIYLLDQGKIIASGNYAELYQNSERFRKMAMMQDMNR